MFKPHVAIPSWLIEYAAVLLSKYQQDKATRLTAYQFVHGQHASERLPFFFSQRKRHFALRSAAGRISA